MKLLLDTADIEKIEEKIELLPIIKGVTTNPIILNSINEKDVYSHLRNIRKTIGKERELHVQIIDGSYKGILQDAYKIVDLIDSNVIVKVPVTKNSVLAIEKLKEQNIKVTGTAIYSTIQGYIATEIGCDYIAPYVNRMLNINTNPYEVINSVNRMITAEEKKTSILAASFKNISQLVMSIEAGADSVTVNPSLIDDMFNDSNVEFAVKQFSDSWFGKFNKSNF